MEASKYDSWTEKEKIEIASRTPQIQEAVKMLIGLMEDIEAKNYIEMDFVLNVMGVDLADTKFKLKIQRLPVDEPKKEDQEGLILELCSVIGDSIGTESEAMEIIKSRFTITRKSSSQ